MNKKKISKLLCLVMAMMMLFTLFTGNVSAATASFSAPTSPTTVDKNAITMAAHSQAWITPEVLGINNTTSRNSELSENFYSGADYNTSAAIAALGVFGSDINDNPNPYLYNYFYNCYATKNGLSPTALGTYTLCYSIGGSPMAAAVAPVDSLGGVCSSLYLRPDILLGVDPVNTETNTTGYTASINALPENTNSDTTDNYAPYQVVYTTQHVYDFLDSMYELSDIVKEIKSNDSSKTTRYEDPYAITSDIEKYVKGLESYVLKKIDEDNATKPVVAVVNYSVSKSAQDAGTIGANDFVVNTKGYSVEPTTNFSRVAEFVADTTTNIVDKIGEKNVPKKTIAASTSKNVDAYVVSADQIAQYADIVIFSEVKSSVPENNGTNGTAAAVKTAIASSASEANKTRAENIDYFETAFSCVGSIGANSVENLLGMAYYTAYCYPQYLNQFDVATYWYRNFYHITDNTKLKSIIAANFADSSIPSKYENTYTTDISSYNEAALEDKIVEGMKYYEANKSKFEGKLLYQNGKTGKNTGWDIDWTVGIGSGAQDNVNVVTPSDTSTSKVTATVSDATKETVKDAIIENFTPEELEQYNFGADLDVEIALTPVNEKDVSADVVKNIQSALAKGEKIGAYLNIDITYTLGNNDAVKVTDLGNDEIEITVSLPTELQGKGTYVIYREHDGKVDAIVPTVSADGKSLTFKSSKFSTYAIAYTEKATVANTADNTAVVATVCTVSAAAIGFAVVSKRRKEIEA